MRLLEALSASQQSVLQRANQYRNIPYRLGLLQAHSLNQHVYLLRESTWRQRPDVPVDRNHNTHHIPVASRYLRDNSCRSYPTAPPVTLILGRKST